MAGLKKQVEDSPIYKSMQVRCKDFRTVQVAAHRGAPFRAVENTLESFKEALRLGADILETDVRLTRDGHLLVIHDNNTERLSDLSRPVSLLTRKELENLTLKSGGFESKPLFMDDALRLLPNAVFSVDLKDADSRIVDAWCKLLKEKNAGHRCITCSFNYRTLQIFRKRNRDAMYGMSRRHVIFLLLASLVGLAWRPGRRQGLLSIPEYFQGIRVINRRRLNMWQKKGWKIFVWTVNDEEDMKRFIEWGVDGIITDCPERTGSVLGRV